VSIHRIEDAVSLIMEHAIAYLMFLGLFVPFLLL